MTSSQVVIVKGKGVLSQDGNVNLKKLLCMYTKGFQILTGQQNIKEALNLIFKKNDRVGIKINTLGGKRLSSRREIPLSLANLLVDSGLQPGNIIIWDRINRELKDAGYSLNINNNGFKVFGTDTQGVGYNPKLISHLNIGSRFSYIQSDIINASCSLAVLKDHGMAGITAGMKNYFGAIHNPNKYHDSNCDPFIAELFETTYIKEKHRLTILDSLVVQYHRGPSYHNQWAKKSEILIFSLDPVAADFAGWQFIEKLRAMKGLPSLKEEGREPVYLKTAEKMGLGIATQKKIQITEEEL